MVESLRGVVSEEVGFNDMGSTEEADIPYSGSTGEGGGFESSLEQGAWLVRVSEVNGDSQVLVLKRVLESPVYSRELSLEQLSC